MSSHAPVAKQPTWAELAPKLDTPLMKERVAELIRRYPSPQAALLQVLWLAQAELGWMPQAAIKWSAEQCNTSPAHAYGVATFYTQYLKAPLGRFLLQICQNVCCHVMGAEPIIHYAEKQLDMHADGASVSADGLFSLLRVECLGACGNGPVMQVNDEFATDVVDGKLAMPVGVQLTPERFDRIIAWCKANPSKAFIRDSLGGNKLGDFGHPGAAGASAAPQKGDYAPAAPALAVNAIVRDPSGTTITWKAAPEVTELRIEKSNVGSFAEVGKVTGKDKEFVDPVGKVGDQYRVVAVSGARVAKPSNVATTNPANRGA